MVTVLIVDDLPEMTETLQLGLEVNGQQVILAHNGVNALERLQESTIDLMLLDIHLPEKDGIEVLTEMRSLAQRPKIIAMSGGGRTADFAVLEVAKQLGASATLQKSFTMKELMVVVDSLITT